MVRTEGLRHVDLFKDCFSPFLDGPNYARSFQILADQDQLLVSFEPAIRAGLCIPRLIGQFVVERQLYLLQSLSILSHR